MKTLTYFISIGVCTAVIIAALFFAHTVATPAQNGTNPATLTSTQVPQAATNTAHAVPTPNAPSESNPRTVAATTSTPLAPLSSYTVPVNTKETVLAAMYAYASSSSFAFTGENYPSLGFFVDSIGGRANADGNYWILYVNGTSSSLGASSAMVSSGDTVEWRYEKGD